MNIGVVGKSIVLGKRSTFLSDWMSINYSALSQKKRHLCYRSRSLGARTRVPPGGRRAVHRRQMERTFSVHDITSIYAWHVTLI